MALAELMQLRVIGFRIQGDIGPLTCYTSSRKQQVWFPRTPPDVPASRAQIAQRDKFRGAGFFWNQLDEHQKYAWQDISRRAHLRIHGYALYTYFLLTKDRYAIETLQEQTGVIVL